MNTNDFLIKKEWDDTLNQRIIIIYGNSLNNGNNKNGELDIVSNSRPETYYHATYLQYHAQNNYNDDLQYQNYVERSKATFNYYAIIFLQTNKYNNIVFANTSNNGKKNGVFFFPPNTPTKEQYQKLNEILPKLNDYDEILVNGKTYINEYSMLDNDISFTIKGKDINKLETLMNKQYQQYNSPKRR